MTQLKFIYLCNERLIDPDIALENEEIQDALEDKDDVQVVYLLDTEF